MTNYKIFLIYWLLLIYQVQYSVAHESDSLQSALEAITQRQRDLSDLSDLYYLGQDGNFHRFGEEIVVYFPQKEIEGDGQPEDIGYGYQKSIAPKTAGIFEPIPLPQSELGIHVSNEKRPQRFEKLLLNYLEENNEQPEHDENPNMFRSKQPDSKRSIFRERGDGNLPDVLQSLYLDDTKHIPFYNDDDEQQQKIPSLFRERFTGSFQPLNDIPALVPNLEDPDRHDNSNDSDDDYIQILNSVWKKYKESSLDSLDPEDISENDAAELMDYTDTKDTRKRQFENTYQSGFDFFNSPLQWTKRSRSRLSHSYKSDLNSRMFLDESGEQNQVVPELLLSKPYFNKHEKKSYKEKLWQGNAFDERYPLKSISKRYPVAKRSPSFHNSPRMVYYKSSTNVAQREKENVNNENFSSKTDPKVAQELSDIFAESTVKDNIHLNNLDRDSSNLSSSNSHIYAQNRSENKLDAKINNLNASDMRSNHIHATRTGQKEETISNSNHKPVEVIKKSVDWSDYFGIDRRRKKSTSKQDVTNEWLLDQYLKAYSLSSNVLKDSTDAFNNFYHDSNNNKFVLTKKGQDDMDAKLRAMEDLIVDQALKYTGAHEGMTDSNQMQEVKDRVISQLAAAYSLEKMRQALSEFKSSIAAQKASAPTTITPNVTPSHPEKRVEVKNGMSQEHRNHNKKEDIQNNVQPSNLLKTFKNYPKWSIDNILISDQTSKTWNCPILQEIHLKCKEMSHLIGDVNHKFVPLCTLHQLCDSCSPQLSDYSPAKCDATFISEAQNICQENASCRYAAHQTLNALRAESYPLDCNWENHSCIAYFLSMVVR